MALLTGVTYIPCVLGQWNGDHPIDFSADTFRVSLLTASYVPDYENHEFFSDLTNEVTGGGYAAETLTGLGIAYDASFGSVIVAADPADFGTITATFQYVALYKWTGSGATSPLIALLDYGAPITKTAENYTLDFEPAANGGMVTLGVS